MITLQITKPTLELLQSLLKEEKRRVELSDDFWWEDAIEQAEKELGL